MPELQNAAKRMKNIAITVREIRVIKKDQSCLKIKTINLKRTKTATITAPNKNALSNPHSITVLAIMP
jgi:hypothetical protein